MGSKHCSAHTLCMEPLKALDKVSSSLLRNEKKTKKQVAMCKAACRISTITCNRIWRLQTYTFSSTLCGLRCFPSTGSDCSPSLCCACCVFVSGTVSPCSPIGLLQVDIRSNKGVSTFLEDYFAILYVELLCDTPSLPFTFQRKRILLLLHHVGV